MEQRWLLNAAPVAADDAFTVGQHDFLVKPNPGVLANDVDSDGDPLQITGVDTSSTEGDVAWNKNGGFAYDLAGKFDHLVGGETATDTFSYTVSDGRGGTDTAIVTITILGWDDPIAGPDSYETDQDTMLDVPAPGLLANDSHPDASVGLEVSSVGTSQTLGQVTWNADGSFTYDPNGSFQDLPLGEEATDSFTYTVADDKGGSDTAVVTITVQGLNDAPVAADDAYQTEQNTPLDVAALSGLLANDTDPGAVLSVTAVDTSGTLGQVTWNADGSFTYDPSGQFDALQEGETASDTFTYTVNDEDGAADTATVTITVTSGPPDVEDGPVAAADEYQTDEKTPLEVPLELGLLANDTHPDANAVLTVTDVDTSGTLGHVSWNEDGSLEYRTFGWFADLAEDSTGTDVFTYTVSDQNGRSDTASVVITVIGVNDSPNAGNEFFETDEETVLVVPAPGMLSNDFDVDFGDVLSVSSVDTGNLLGSLVWAPDGSFEYDPDGQFDRLGDGESATETFTYTAADQHGASDTATVTITITGVGPIINDDPLAGDDAYLVREDATLTVAPSGVLANDSDPDGDPLHVSGVDTMDTQGRVTWNHDGGFFYDPLGEFEYLALDETATDTFVYTVRDGRGGSDTATVTITIEGVNQPPRAVDDAYATAKDTVLDIPSPGLLTNDSDPNGDDFEVMSVDTTGTRGVVTWSPDGGFAYDPNGQFNALLEGEVATDVFTYTMMDVHEETDTATVTITVTGFNNPDNRPPVAVDDGYEVDKDARLVMPAPGLLANDTDPDGDPLHVLSVDWSGTRGLVAFVSDGSFGYDPFGNFDDLPPGQTATDTFIYTVSDGQGGTDTATVTIVVSGGPGEENQPPVAEDDAYATSAHMPLTIAAPGLLANDSDPDPDDVLGVIAVDTTETIGTLTWAADGSFHYDPAAGFDHLSPGETAIDTFNYTVDDGRDGTDSATVTITITGVDTTRPAAVDDEFSTDKNLVLLVRAPGLLANDLGDDISIIADDTTETIGLVAWTKEGGLGYDPSGEFDFLQPGETATDTLTYTIEDSLGFTDTATVTITITNRVEGPPSLTIDDASVVEGDGEPVSMLFTVTLAPAVDATVRVDYTTADGSARQELDYEAVSGTLVFEPDATTQTIAVPVIGNTIDEFDETFHVTLTEADNALITRDQATGTIIDDDEAPAISINDVTVLEGDDGLSEATFAVSLSAVSGKPITVDYATADGSATADEDYRPASGTVSFAPGETAQQIAVSVIGDTKFEPDETFSLTLNNASNATISRATAIGTILNDDDRPTISIADAEVWEGHEGSSDLVFSVSLSHPSYETISVDFATADGTATVADGDYEPNSGSLVFQPSGALVQPVTVKVWGDTVEEDDETLFVNLSNATNAPLAGARATGAILDDDASQASLSGAVYFDVNNNGIREAWETGVPGMTVRLQGVDHRGDGVAVTTVTDDDGSYLFNHLAAGTYEIIKTPHAAFINGRDTGGSLGGHLENDRIWGIALGGDETGIEYNFGELGLRPEYISVRLFFASTPPVSQYLPPLMAAVERQQSATAVTAPSPTPAVSIVPQQPPTGTSTTPLANDRASREDSAEGESEGAARRPLLGEAPAPLGDVHDSSGLVPLNGIADMRNAAIGDDGPWNVPRTSTTIPIASDFVRRESDQREDGLRRAAFHPDKFNRLEYNRLVDDVMESLAGPDASEVPYLPAEFLDGAVARDIRPHAEDGGDGTAREYATLVDWLLEHGEDELCAA